MTAKVQRGEVQQVEVMSWHDLDAVAADARGRLDRAAQPRLFDRLDWFRLTLAHCPPPGRLLVIKAEDASAACWAFLTADRGDARLLGSWYTLAGGLVRFHHAGPAPASTVPPIPPREDSGAGGPRDESGVTDASVEAVARFLRRDIHHVTFAPLAGEDLPALTAGFQAAGWRVRSEVATQSWRVATTDGWNGYWAARPSQLRATVRRRARAANLDIRILDRFDPVAWAAYEEVYRASWKPPEGSAAFLRALAEQEGAAGTLRLGIAEKDGQALAAQLWLVENGIATIHKLAHRRDADALSPGTLLSAAMFRRAIEVDCVRAIDFGTGDEPYKADWMDRREPLHRLDAWNPRSARGLAGFVRATAGALVRRARRH